MQIWRRKSAVEPRELAFLTSSQMMLMLLVQEPLFKQQRSNWPKWMNGLHKKGSNNILSKNKNTQAYVSLSNRNDENKTEGIGRLIIRARLLPAQHSSLLFHLAHQICTVQGCYGVKPIPLKFTCWSPTPVHQNGAIFKERTFEEVIKLKWSP